MLLHPEVADWEQREGFSHRPHPEGERRRESEQAAAAPLEAVDAANMDCPPTQWPWLPRTATRVVPMQQIRTVLQHNGRGCLGLQHLPRSTSRQPLPAWARSTCAAGETSVS